MKLSTTDRKRYKSCRRKWELASPHKMGLAKKDTNENLSLGIAIHDALESYYNDEDYIKTFLDYANENQFDEELTKLGKGMLEHYDKFAKKNDHKYFNEVVETEFKFKVPIKDISGKPTGHYYVGRVDGLVKDDIGRYWLLEHKTASQISTGHLPLDEQVVSYMWAVQESMGIELEGVVYNILLKKLPTQPKVLKSGHLSVAKNIRTTKDAYLNALEEHYGDEIPMDRYQDILEILGKKDNTFFDRERVRKTPYEIINIGNRIYHEVMEIEQSVRHDNLSLYPNPDRQCTYMCDFREVCIEMEKGRDTTYLINELYDKQEPRY